MPAPSKAWVVIADTAVDPDSPLDTALITGLRDNQINLDERLGGANYPAGRSLQDHTHDGVDSAAIDVGPNAIRNGSFESDTAGWTVTTYTGGSQAINTTQEMDGAKCLALTSTSTVNGGGEALSNEFRTCTGGALLYLRAAIKASVANVSSRIRVMWFDDAKAALSNSVFYSATNTPTVNTMLGGFVAAPAAARFYKVELVGGVPGSGSATGTVYFDGVFASDKQQVTTDSVSGTLSGTSVSITGIPAGVDELFVSVDGAGSLSASNLELRVGTSSGLESTGYTQGTSNNGVALGGIASGAFTFWVYGRRRPGTNTWFFTGVLHTGAFVAARKTLAAVLDRVGLVIDTSSFNQGTFRVEWR